MAFSVASSYSKLRSLVESATPNALPPPSSIYAGVNALPKDLPGTGLGDAATVEHLLHDVVPGFNGTKTSANYYGFVTGGVFPIAEVADNIVTAFDQNVQVHLPDQSISTSVEDRALSMLVQLLDLGQGWDGRTFTTGATSANILGLACGREAVVAHRLKERGEDLGVGELGLLTACARAGVTEIQVLTTIAHSSTSKAASVVGLGRASVKSVSLNAAQPWKFDMELLEKELAREGVVSIVALSAGEVNTGRFATENLDEMKAVRSLCDKYHAWLHVDGAFGLFARCLPSDPEFAALRSCAAGIELADSIACDGHKMLNVPYDCGFFLTHTPAILNSVFQNPNAAYLASSSSGTAIPSPLNIGLENSRRFRALPVYAVLLSLGHAGLAAIFVAQVRLTRAIAAYLDRHAAFEVLAVDSPPADDAAHTFPLTQIVVLFRAKDEALNLHLPERINALQTIYVSPTKWEGRRATRFAISTWRVDVERDMATIASVLDQVATTDA